MARRTVRLGITRQRHERQLTDDERRELTAYARWSMTYRPGVAEIDRLEAFKAGYRAARGQNSAPAETA